MDAIERDLEEFKRAAPNYDSEMVEVYGYCIAVSLLEWFLENPTEVNRVKEILAILKTGL